MPLKDRSLAWWKTSSSALWFFAFMVYECRRAPRRARCTSQTVSGDGILSRKTLSYSSIVPRSSQVSAILSTRHTSIDWLYAPCSASKQTTSDYRNLQLITLKQYLYNWLMGQENLYSTSYSRMWKNKLHAVLMYQEVAGCAICEPASEYRKCPTA